MLRGLFLGVVRMSALSPQSTCWLCGVVIRRRELAGAALRRQRSSSVNRNRPSSHLFALSTHTRCSLVCFRSTLDSLQSSAGGFDLIAPLTAAYKSGPSRPNGAAAGPSHASYFAFLFAQFKLLEVRLPLLGRINLSVSSGECLQTQWLAKAR